MTRRILCEDVSDEMVMMVATTNVCQMICGVCEKPHKMRFVTYFDEKVNKNLCFSKKTINFAATFKIKTNYGNTY